MNHNVLALVFSSAGLVLSLTGLVVSWRFWQKTDRAGKENRALARTRVKAASDVTDALAEWHAAVCEMESGIYSSRAVDAGGELKRLLEVHVLGRTP
jgi:hypothetical protein